MRVQVINSKYNKEKYGFMDEKDLLAYLFEKFLKKRDLKYRSIENLREIVKEIALMVYEIIEPGVTTDQKRKASGLKRKITNFIRFAETIKTTEDIVAKSYDFLLGLEGLSTLAGFGMADKSGGKFRGRVAGNPERVSVSQ